MEVLVTSTPRGKEVVKNEDAGARMVTRTLASDETTAHQCVSNVQRARIIAGMISAVAELGVQHVTVAEAVSRAGVSRRTFYDTFSDREDCLLAAFDDAIALARERVLPLCQGEDRWRERIRVGVSAALGFLDAERALARLLIVESLACGPAVLERRERVLAGLVIALDQGRDELTATAHPLSPAPVTAQGLLGGALAVVYSRVVADGPGSLLDLAGPLTSMIVLPYLGAAIAREELENPVTRTPVAVSSPKFTAGGDPLRGVPMRITYRVIMTLAAIAEHPGSSNRQIGEIAGIADQGQISKLLARLHRHGLIENSTGNAHEKGDPHAWTLTGKGHRLREATSGRPPTPTAARTPLIKHPPAATR